VSETPIHNLLTVKEAAEYLRIPLPTIYYLVQRGKIPAIQIGGRFPRKYPTSSSAGSCVLAGTKYALEALDHAAGPLTSKSCFSAFEVSRA
jgi:excisionase family DNA binding protein